MSVVAGGAQQQLKLSREKPHLRRGQVESLHLRNDAKVEEDTCKGPCGKGRLAGFMAALQAIISVAEDAGGGKDKLHSVSAGPHHKMVFLTRGPVYLAGRLTLHPSF